MSAIEDFFDSIGKALFKTLGVLNEHFETKVCSLCKGTGKNRVPLLWSPWDEPQYFDCAMCQGKGRIVVSRPQPPRWVKTAEQFRPKVDM